MLCYVPTSLAMLLVHCVLLMVAGGMVECSNSSIVLHFPLNEFTPAVSDAVSVTKSCSFAATGTSVDAAAVVNFRSSLVRLAANFTTGRMASVLLVVASKQILDKRVLLSSTTIARAIVELTVELGWNRTTIVADVSDTYFLRTAEELYRTMAGPLSDVNFLQLSNANSKIESTVSRIDRLNLRIVVLSLRPSIVSKLLCSARRRHLVWPEYAWIVHSVDLNGVRCDGKPIVDGVITVQHSREASRKGRGTDEELSLLNATEMGSDVVVYNTTSCYLSEALQVDIALQVGASDVLTGRYNNGLVLNMSDGHTIPSALPPQFSPTVYIALYYIGTCVCFVLVTATLVLYFCYRNRPSVKATSVSLSILIFVGCYMLIFYLCVINFALLPSYHKRSTKFRNVICVFRVWIHGLGFPIALIMSTLLVKLLRVYRIFNCHGKISRHGTQVEI